MKKSRSIGVFAAVIAATAFSLAAQGASNPAASRLSPVWSTAKELAAPESVLFDEARSVIYVSSINGDAVTKDGNGFISVLSPEGKMISRQWISGLDAPKGLALVGGRLYVSDIDRLVEIDTASGTISHVYQAEGAQFLNDTTADRNGTVYVSDYAEGHSAIYRLMNGRLELWLLDERLSQPNGLVAEADRLVAGALGGKLLAVSYDTKVITVLADLSKSISGIDGIVSLGNGTYLVSDWSGTILRVQTGSLGSGGPEVLSNTSKEGINAADISYATKEGLLLVPTFGDNRVTAYRISDR